MRCCTSYVAATTLTLEGMVVALVGATNNSVCSSVVELEPIRTCKSIDPPAAAIAAKSCFWLGARSESGMLKASEEAIFPNRLA
ncbi:hypothetical protein D3C76_318830 [compost metagenome]